MKRCNKPAIKVAIPSGFRVCAKHVREDDRPTVTWQPMGKSWRTDGTNPCDQPIETREEFWKRHPNSRMYRKLFATK